jgi:hypothetical protein
MFHAPGARRRAVIVGAGALLALLPTKDGRFRPTRSCNNMLRVRPLSDVPIWL